MALTNMADVQSIARSLRNIDAVIIGTKYQLEARPVTGNTYEKSPNDKTNELYLDQRKTAWSDYGGDESYHLKLFRNTIEACCSANVQHVVIIETPKTAVGTMDEYALILDEANVSFTYIRLLGELQYAQDYTFEKGLQGSLEIRTIELGSNMGNTLRAVLADMENPVSSSSNAVLYREDIAALAVQSLMTLEWNKSRFMDVTGSAKQNHEEAPKARGKPLRSDLWWCVGSERMAEKLSSVI